MTQFFEYSLKFIIVGDTSVGKSNLLLQFTDRKFQPKHNITIAVEYGTKLISRKNIVYKLKIWDTAGQEAFRSITRLYYRDAIGCLLVYDITQRDTFLSLSRWLKHIKKNVSENASIVLIGNKSDLESERVVTKEEGSRFANDNNLVFFETSARANINVENVYIELIDQINRKINDGIIEISPHETNIDIMKDNISIINEKNGWCCSLL